MVLVRRDGAIGWCDENACALFGYAREDVFALPFWTLFTPDCRDAVAGVARSRPSDPARVRATAVDKAGIEFEVEITSTRTPAVRGGEAGVVQVVSDVTDRCAVEAALLACAAAGDSWSLPDALARALGHWIPEAELTVGFFAHRCYRRLAPRSPAAMDPLDGQHLDRVTSPVWPVVASGQTVVVQDTHAQTFRVDACLAARGIGSYVLIPLVDDAHVFGVLNVAFPEPTLATPRIVRLLSVVAESIGSPLALRCQRLDRPDDAVLALISHEMRTPLAVIAGFAGTLRENWDGLAERERVEGLDAILRNGRNLTRLVEQDLQLALLESGELRYEIGSFDLSEQLERTVADFMKVANAPVQLEVERALPHVRGDEQRNWQVLENLLSNALKFSPSGTPIEVGACRNNGMVHVTVRDHGPGISRADCRRLFQKFSRVREPHVRHVPGTGLGLYLSRCMVEAQGGRIWVASRRGEGAAFTYTLPVAAEAGISAQPW